MNYQKAKRIRQLLAVGAFGLMSWTSAAFAADHLIKRDAYGCKSKSLSGNIKRDYRVFGA
jgi:hypothetical protein